MNAKNIIIGCLIGASFFIACKSENAEAEVKEPKEKKEYIMYEESELAVLMRKMYADNLEIRAQIMKGELPESFPEDFYTIHTAEATDPSKIDETFKSMADLYIVNMKKITEAQSESEAKVTYNNMIMTCASCHQIYCQGPLPKIRKMIIPIEE